LDPASYYPRADEVALNSVGWRSITMGAKPQQQAIDVNPSVGLVNRLHVNGDVCAKHAAFCAVRRDAVEGSQRI
jgi:hypothetical protein